MEFIYNDGGRSNYFKGSNVGDCVCRALCNTTGVDYKVMYDLINKVSKLEKHSNKSNARNGVYKDTIRKILKALQAEEIKVQEFGSNKKCHLCDEDLVDYQKGKYLLSLSHHNSSLIDGKLVDTYDCSRDGDRQVYKMYKMTKTVDEYNQLIEQFNIELDKKIDNKEKRDKSRINKKNKILRKLNELEKEEIELRKRLREISNEKFELNYTLNHKL